MVRPHLVHLLCHRCGFSAFVGAAFFERQVARLANRSPYAMGPANWPFSCCDRCMVMTPVREDA